VRGGICVTACLCDNVVPKNERGSWGRGEGFEGLKPTGAGFCAPLAGRGQTLRQHYVLHVRSS